MKFNVTGITVDSQNSTEFKVSLKNLSIKSSGTFTCEVISDDNFETFREASNMTVIDPPDRNAAGKFGPEIEVAGWSGTGPLEVRDGEQVEAVCLARGSNPPAPLTWYNNNTEVPREFVRPQTSRTEGHNTYTTSLRLILSAGQLWDDQGRLLLRCTADIPGLFHEAAHLELLPTQPLGGPSSQVSSLTVGTAPSGTGVEDQQVWRTSRCGGASGVDEPQV
ncbi:uncharacterized protein LOC121860245 [Homarus americanus]|uniref:uncharacterized protein LOC121860245 n=1 Tax=Homarus americanus TaxID=6706 RepID=UPI001C47BBA0|nr:uncharacterized protein LOC121860245 [Homarus americanus]